MLNNNKVTTILPHDPEVKTFPFSDLPISDNFRKIYKSLHSKGILGKIERRSAYSDVPQFFVYACKRSSGKNKVNVSYGFGGSEDESDAISHAISEAIEHYCILHERESMFIHGTYNKLKPNAVDPLRFTPFTQKQLSTTKYKKFIITPDTFLNWLEGYSLTNRRNILIPASLAYANYSSKKHNEPTIRRPISTGAACGPTVDFAIYRGLCEIIERDGYMISFLSEMPKKLITVDPTNKELSDFVRRFERYNFELFFIDTTLESKVFSVVCLLIDRSGSGPAVCAGLGARLEPNEAIKSSAIEALRRYNSNRDLFFRPRAKSSPKKYSFNWSIRKKQQLWSAPHMIKQAENFIKGAGIVKLPKPMGFKSDKEKVQYLVAELQKLNYEVFYIDMTIPEVEKLGLKVIKVLVPEMVPLWYDERYPYLGMSRLSEIPQKYNIRVNLDLNLEELIRIHPF